ncbi:hypothetical protein PVBG_04771 [Plasmodium vivax Brazil I]|uniref:PIR Superfamily Protein n=1 Tax=Plasmodium vivax (strain Brazil I) TaxID=1033975 RepID=A0A0J9T1T5_PLAV1|nr:hypothetical protein PVBG_04771 [Plasmodium vivax Brazil I]
MNKRNNYKICYSDTYDKYYEEPIKKTLLYIFENNMKNLKNILIGRDDSHKTHCQKFVCECVKIYKNVYSSYCNGTNPIRDKNKNTCDTLNNLKIIYNQYLFHEKDLMNKVPSLDGSIQEFWDRCKPDEKMLAATGISDIEQSILPYLDRDRGENIPKSFPPREHNVENLVSPMSRTVSTTVGTVAGASSILALLYKVTLIFI